MTTPTSSVPFSDRLTAAVRRCRNPVVVGLDPRVEQLPAGLQPADHSASASAAAYRTFCCGVIDAVAALVPAVKPQIAFFEARRGKLHGFRFRDPFDFKSCAPSATPTANDQILGAGDGERVTFSLLKAYGAGETAYLRPISKPVAGSALVAIDGAPLAPGAFTVASESGIVTLDAAPVLGAVVSAGFIFDTPVRFDIDRLDLSIDGFGAGHAVAIPLVEVRA